MNFKSNIKAGHSSNQSGVALITVLFIFALASMLAISIQTQQEQAIRQATATLQNTQTFLTLISIEDIAKAGLMFDSKRDTDANELWDTASELWNQPFPISLDTVQVAIYIRDLQGLFNLNSLHPEQPNNMEAKARFSRLLADLAIDDSVAANLREWFTKGSVINYEYENMTPAYSSPEVEFTHPSELLLVKGMNEHDFKRLEPFVTALPRATPLNINTSLPEVLSSWDSGLTLDQSKEIINKTRSNACGPQERNNFAFKEASELLIEPSIKALVEKSGEEAVSNWEVGDFDVKTQYFSVISIIKTEEREVAMESIIKRDSESNFIGTIYRDFSRQPEDINRLIKTMNCAGV